MRQLLCLFIITLALGSCAFQPQQEVQAEVSNEVKQNILEQMEDCRKGWNSGDFERYMQVY